MGADDPRTADQQRQDVMAWAMNVLSSVLIVFVNKLLMDPRSGFGFVFGASTPLEAPHPDASALGLARAARGYRGAPASRETRFWLTAAPAGADATACHPRSDDALLAALLLVRHRGPRCGGAGLRPERADPAAGCVGCPRQLPAAGGRPGD
jgi:hypothetical protein